MAPPVVFQKSTQQKSSRLAMVEGRKAPHRAVDACGAAKPSLHWRRQRRAGLDQPVAQALVVPSAVVMGNMLGENVAQMELSEGHDVAETLEACLADPSL